VRAEGGGGDSVAATARAWGVHGAFARRWGVRDHVQMRKVLAIVPSAIANDRSCGDEAARERCRLERLVRHRPARTSPSGAGKTRLAALYTSAVRHCLAPPLSRYAPLATSSDSPVRQRVLQSPRTPKHARMWHVRLEHDAMRRDATIQRCPARQPLWAA